MNPVVAHIALQFAQIEGSDYRSIIRFYEENILDIHTMDEAEKNFYNYEYIMALFNLGRYHQVLLQIDELIEYVFLQEMEYTGDNTYEHLIFKKSAALMNTQRTAEARKIAGDLVRMNPGKEDFRKLYMKISRHDYYLNCTKLRSTSIIIILIASILSMFAWSLNNTVQPVYADNLFFISLSMNFSVLALIAYHFTRSYWRARMQLRLVAQRSS